jgi:hypothetical protein
LEVLQQQIALTSASGTRIGATEIGNQFIQTLQNFVLLHVLGPPARQDGRDQEPQLQPKF